MTDKPETFCRYRDTDEARAFREAIERRVETESPEEVSRAINLSRKEWKELRASFIIGNPGSGMMKRS